MLAAGDQPPQCGSMAIPANPVVAFRGLCAERSPMRVMARSAGKGARAFQKAGGFKQPVPSVGDLELVRVTGSQRLVKVKDIIAKRLSRAVGKIAAAVTPDGIRQPVAGGFQMTL